MTLLLSACSSQANIKEVKTVLEQQFEADQFYAEKQCEQAVPLYLKLAEAMPTDSKSLLRVGNCQARAGDYRAAEQTYQQALLRDPANAKLWYNLSYVQARVLANTVSQMYENVPANSPDAERVRALTVDVLAPFDIELDHDQP
jgi:tetratricopeptide (TPR) repeat protein